MAERLRSRVAIVTGGLRGIGRATVLALAAEGAVVAIFDVDPADSPALESLLAAAGASGASIRYMQADATSTDEVTDATNKVLQEFGVLDILVNNVGVGAPQVPLEQVPERQWNELVARNLSSAFVCSKAVVSAMKAQGRGRIINVSSQAGRSRSEIGNLAYASAKAGLLGFTRQLASELGPFGVTVNAVAPGLTLSERVVDRLQAFDEAAKLKMIEAVPLRRLGRPEEIAAVIVFLASDDSSYIAGATIDVNGGRFMM